MTYPDTLTTDYLERHLAILEGWQADAQAVIDDMPEQTQKASERLAKAMTEEEIEAARALFFPVRGLLEVQARKVHERMGPASHELSLEDVQGLSWPVFIRCLATYDRSKSHLTTHLTINAKSIFRRYVLSVRDRDDTERNRRARRNIYQLEARTMTRKGRKPTRREYADAVRQVGRYEDYDSRRVSRLVDYLTSSDAPIRLDRTIGDEDEQTLHDIVPSDTQSRLDTEALGQALAEELGEEALWDALTTRSKA